MSNQSASKSKISRWLWIFCQSSKLCRLQLRNLSSWLCGQMKVIFHTFVLLSGRFLTNGSECFVHTCSYMWMYNIQIYMYIHGDEMICMSQMQCKLSFHEMFDCFLDTSSHCISCSHVFGCLMQFVHLFQIYPMSYDMFHQTMSHVI